MPDTRYLPDGFLIDAQGHHFNFLGPTHKFNLPNAIHVIAHIPRFGGRIKHFYSVAAHCMWVHDYVSQIAKEDRDLQLAALTHDLSEFAFGDISTPVKRFVRGVCPEFDSLIHKWEEAVAKRFKLPMDLYAHPLIKEADTAALLAEAFDLGYGMPNAERPPTIIAPPVWPSGPGEAIQTYTDRLLALGVLGARG